MAKTDLIGELSDVVNSRAVRMVLEERKVTLQKEVNACVRKQDWYSAFGAVAKLDDVEKFILMCQNRLDELKNEK